MAAPPEAAAVADQLDATPAKSAISSRAWRRCFGRSSCLLVSEADSPTTGHGLVTEEKPESPTTRRVTNGRCLA